MQVRAARVVAVSALVAVVTSMVMTCVPGSMSMHAGQAAPCAAVHDHQPVMSAGFGSDCCVHHQPSLTAAKLDLRHSALQQLASAESLVPSVVGATSFADRNQAPPGLASTVGPPIYITLSTLRV